MSGRDFQDTDQPTSLPVAVVSETFGRRRLGTAQAADRRVMLADETAFPVPGFEVRLRELDALLAATDGTSV